ncbi:MAG: DUF445 family protein [Epsilonproteobacteria bacterium]|nr:DUF445 family protein [Campylobacterota bacterium]MBD3839133.1 DUF445 family protein [Campylobacterota bacterium]
MYFILPQPYAKYSLDIGLFALSGAVTNQLAIYMLFHKVPFLYGSGVIEKNFESFKMAIKNMMMKEFFTVQQIKNFFTKEDQKIDLKPMISIIDFNPAFNAISTTILESKFGDMIKLFGAEKNIESFREPFILKIRENFENMVDSNQFKDAFNGYIMNSSLSQDLINSVDSIIDDRLNQLTPVMIKEIVQHLISKHLGWLVVWGGVLGGLIGLISSVVFSVIF